MSTSKPKSFIVLSTTLIILGFIMIGYWTKYILDGMSLKNVPIASEMIAAILAFITGVGLYQMRKWSVATGILLSGFWIYGCVAGINMAVYDVLVYSKLEYQSPIGPWIDAILYLIVTLFAIFLSVFLWRMRKIFVDGDYENP